jgi:mitochondrial chaperone BCS1
MSQSLGSNNTWRHTSCRPKRSLNSVILDPGMMEGLLRDAKDFLGSKSWYAERGIPFRRGYLLVRILFLNQMIVLII